MNNKANKTSFKKGHKSFSYKGMNKGIHCSPKTEFKKGIKTWNKGLKGYNIGHPLYRKTDNTGKHWKVKDTSKMKGKSGEKSPSWKGGISKDLSHYRRIRRALKYNAEGSHTQGEWQLLKKQYGFICPCCKRKESEIKLTEDHIIPLSRGGSDWIENIQPLCVSCNSRKHAKTIKYEPDINRARQADNDYEANQQFDEYPNFNERN